MDKQIKARWVAALRSGEYKQGRGLLRSANNEFCCLGVLCDVVASAGWREPDEDCAVWTHDGETELPSPESLEKLGLRGAEVFIEGETASLDEHNDGAIARGVKPRTFAEIADAIEEQL